jgi:anthranilate phosphoribosyltransferase
VAVVKHGNRAVSSRCGSTDVLGALGIDLVNDPIRARSCLEYAGLVFCFAPYFHPAMQAVAALRSRLGVRTLFNCLGPLLNPAGVKYQLLGVGRQEWLDPLAGALVRLGTRHAFLVHSRDGQDEVSLSAPTLVREVQDGSIRCLEWTSGDLGLPSCRIDDLRADGPEASAAIIRSICGGQPGSTTNVVLANAAAALLAVGRVRTLPDGVALASEVLRTGKARRVLERLLAFSRWKSNAGPREGD